MKIYISRLQALFHICLISAAMLSLTGCENSRGEDISGDSILIVRNSSDLDLEVWFDGEYIGDVRHHSRQWDVPSGYHEVEISELRGTYAELIHDYFYFEDDEVTEIYFE
jgi:hypothetical protein